MDWGGLGPRNLIQTLRASRSFNSLVNGVYVVLAYTKTKSCAKFRMS